MSDKFFQDMNPQKRSIRNVSLSKAGRNTSRPSSTAQKVDNYDVDEASDNRYEDYLDLKPSKYTDGGSMGKWVLWVVVVLVVLVGAYWVASFFRTGLVEVKLSTVEIANADTSLSSLDVVFASQKTEVSQVVPAKSRSVVESAAKGTITVYNENTKAQDLIIRTRFQAENGKVYRVAKAISIPAAKNGTPGTLDIEVVADEAGESYNQELTTFTVPGLKDNAELYKKIYAKSKSAMSGGQKGEVNIASPEDIARVEGELKETLKNKLLNQMRQSQSNVLLDSLYKIEIDPVLSRDSGDDVEIVLQGSISALLIDRQTLANALAQKLISSYNGEEINLINFDSLNLTTDISADTTSSEVKTISVKIAGSPSFVYAFNVDAFKNKVANKNSNEVLDIVANDYKFIESAVTSVSPAWYGKLPSDVAKITVEESK